MIEGDKYITVVYKIVDFKEFDKTNPLKYNHNGLEAVEVSQGNLIERFELEIDDGYDNGK